MDRSRLSIREYVASFIQRTYYHLKDLPVEFKIKKYQMLVNLPFTKEHLQIHRRLFRWQCWSTLWKFQQMIPIDLDERQRANLRHHIVHVKDVRGREILRERRASLLFPLFSLVAFLPYIQIHSQLRPRDVFEELVLFGTYGGILMMASAVPSWFFGWKLLINRIEFAICILTLFAAASIRGLPELLSIITAALAAVFGMLLCAFSWAAALVAIDKVARRRDYTKHPESHITVSLLNLQGKLEASGYNCGLGADRLDIAKSLDEIATLFGSACSRAYHTGDSSLDDQLDLQFQKIANSLRELRHWVLFPRADTREHLLARLRLYVPAVITGAWDELPRSDYREPNVSKKRLALRFIKHLSIAATPLAILFVLQFLPWAPVWSESFRRFEFGAFAFAWACLWMLMPFYGRTGSQLEHLRKALEMLALFKK
jgi:hypothetical protein